MAGPANPAHIHSHTNNRTRNDMVHTYDTEGDHMRPLASSDQFNDIMSRIGDLAMLNIVWALCCLPVVTIGASTAALFETIRGIREGHDTHIIRRFLKAFPSHFMTNTALTLIFGAFLTLATFDLWYLSHHMSGSSTGALAYGAVATITLIATAGAGFVFPAASRSTRPLRGQIARSYMLALRHPATALATWCITAAPVVIALAVPGGLAFVLFFWGLLFSGVSAWIITALLIRVSILTETVNRTPPED